MQKLVPTLSFDSRHFVSALFGVIGIYYLYRLGRAFISPAVGFFGALFLACNPMWFGYMFFDAKDIPFAAMLLVALYYCLNAMTGRYKSGWLLPFMMVIAAYPIGLILTLRPSLVVRIATPVIVLIAMIPTLVSMYQLFPYQYSFYNILVGGVPGADGRYYIDVWRSALREALRKIPDIPNSKDGIRIYSCGSTLNFLEHPGFSPALDSENSDYIIVLRRCDSPTVPVYDLPIIGEVRRQGVLFATIYSRQKNPFS